MIEEKDTLSVERQAVRREPFCFARDVRAFRTLYRLPSNTVLRIWRRREVLDWASGEDVQEHGYSRGF